MRLHAPYGNGHLGGDAVNSLGGLLKLVMIWS